METLRKIVFEKLNTFIYNKKIYFLIVRKEIFSRADIF